MQGGALGFIRDRNELGVGSSCNISTLTLEAGGFEVQGLSWLFMEFEVSLGYMRLWPKYPFATFRYPQEEIKHNIFLPRL